METPSSSTRRVTRSQAKAAASANAIPTNNIPISKMRLEECESKKEEKCRQRNGRNNNQQQQERWALIDITNDSPIIGLAMGSVTPSSSMAMGKKRAMMTSTATATPGSGEALLRGQVKNLLQKVEEEKSHLFQLPMGHNNSRPFLVHLQSPMNLLAPTPANTPHLNPSQNLPPSLTPTPVQDKFTISQIIVNGKEECEAEEEEMKVTRSLLMEFSEKLEEGSDSSSMVTNETVITTASSAGGVEDDVSSSRWSIQAIAASGSTIDEEEEWVEVEELQEEEEEWVDEDYEEEEEGEGEMACNGGDLEELCQGMKKMGLSGAAGKHTRFVYNSDGEIEGAVAVVVEEEEGCCGGGALVLKGLPPPKGKHLRFHEEEDEE